MAPLHGIDPRVQARLQQQLKALVPKTNSDASALAAMFTQTMAKSMRAFDTAATGGGEEDSGTGNLVDLSGLETLNGIGALGALGSPASLGSLVGLKDGLGALAGGQGLGLLASLGGLTGGKPGTMQAQLLNTLIQALGSASMLGKGSNPLSTPTVTASGGAELVQPAPVSATAKENAKVVADVARKMGVPEDLAVAMMLVESSGNGRAVGDGGTSFGLFQLHEGGMLTAAGLTPEQAFDPRTNATVALRSLAGELGKAGGRSLGQIAADSQRPADKAGYAAKVEANLARARALLAG